MFIPETKLAKSRGDHRRPACFISQSGAYIIANLSRMPWFDPAYALSIGNQIDLTVGDYLDHLADDPGVAVAACYVEGFRPLDGQRWLEAAREFTASGRSIVLYRAGRTSEGARASASRTVSFLAEMSTIQARPLSSMCDSSLMAS